MGLTTVQRYCAACDFLNIIKNLEWTGSGSVRVVLVIFDYFIIFFCVVN